MRGMVNLFRGATFVLEMTNEMYTLPHLPYPRMYTTPAYVTEAVKLVWVNLSTLCIVVAGNVPFSQQLQLRPPP